MPMTPGDDVFSEADLEPDPEEIRARRRFLVDRIATVVAVACAGVLAGGLIALGYCAAPLVFRLTPPPQSGFAMGGAFARFDSIAIGCGVIMLGCEVVRTLLGRRRPTTAARIRRFVAMLMAAGAAYSGLHLSTGIVTFYQAGVRRGAGPEGAKLDSLHQQAELVAKAQIPLAALLIGLHVFTLRSPRDDEEEEAATAPAPLPPGPRKP